MSQSSREIEADNNCSMVAEVLVTAFISIFIAIISLRIFIGAILALRLVNELNSNGHHVNVKVIVKN